MKISTGKFLFTVIASLSILLNACKDEAVVVTVKTYHVTNVNSTSGTIRGTVTLTGSDKIIESGIVYSTSATYPKITNSRLVNSSGSLMDFNVTISGLSTDTTYRFRAFAKTADSTYYGASYTFKPLLVSIETVMVTGGTYKMGTVGASNDENPAHNVTLSTFQLGKFEVTNAQYALFLKSRRVNSAGTCESTEGGIKKLIYSNLKGLYYSADSSNWLVYPGYENLPVINVTWYGANEFCLWAGGRLPTESEWEFSARGGNLTQNNLYSGSNIPGEIAWYLVNTAEKVNPVQAGGGKTPNEVGLYDMSGNVWEWVSDWYRVYPAQDQLNPVGFSDSEAKSAGLKSKVRRGGCWADSDLNMLRVNSRASSIPTANAGSIGFRFARSI